MVATLALLGFAAAHTIHPDRAAQIEAIQRAKPLWVAGTNPRFAAAAPGASKDLCGVKEGFAERLAAAVAAGRVKRQGVPAGVALPESFDSAEQWPKCAKIITDIRDQSNCGCCWAFAAAEAASDRLCIATDAKYQVPLSAEDICFCASEDGCGGGDIDTPWEHVKEHGAVTGGQYHGTGPFGKGLCADFSLPHCHHHGPQGTDPYPAEGEPGCESQSSPQCPKACDSESAGEHMNFKDDKLSFDGEVSTASGEDEIMHAIMTGGPVETAFMVHEDFENYVSGIYHHVTGELAGGHAVRIVGWGVDDGVKYWKVANSWNPYWGEKGYFRIKKGNNEGGIEDQVTFSDASASWGKKNQAAAEILV
jgi:cathepsin B